ncbi:hypothetical protein Leryth_003339, partial [Lithospermum erythrorhizon]
KSSYSTPKSNLQHKQKHPDSQKDDIELNLYENREKSKSLSLNQNHEKSKSLSLFSSIPQPKSGLVKTHVLDSQTKLNQQENNEKSKSLSLFSSIPQPKAALVKTHVLDSQNLINLLSKGSSSRKKVVQFRPPVNPGLSNVDEDDDEEEDEERKRKKAELDGETPSVKSFLSSIPAPRNSVTLGALGSGLGTGRRSVIDADVQGSSLGGGNGESEVGVSGSDGEVSLGGESGAVEYVNSGDYSSWGSGNENYANVDGYSGYGGGDGNVDYANWNAASGEYSSNGRDYGNYASYGQYANNWTDGSSVAAAAPEVPIERALRLPAKRGRKDDPPQIIEVSQDELMKNRPREDQAKITGIAFGPAYQPASSKGKPSKLHKRKHQIGALYFDMKQKETELAERRSKGFLTKAQTQGKYGW